MEKNNVYGTSVKYLLENAVIFFCLFPTLLQAQQPKQIQVATTSISGYAVLPIKDSPRHDSAMRYTSGVIGNSFYGNEFIGNNKVDPPAGEWTPIDGFKRIQSGKLIKHYIRRLEGNGDDDVNFYLEPNVKDIYFLNYLKTRPYKNPITNKLESNRSSPSDWHEIIAEIDVHDNQKKYFYPYLPTMPLKNLTVLNAYGPFVHDGIDNVLAGSTYDSHDYIEVHPAEQIWWTNTINIGFGTSDEYNLLLLSDNSGRYNNQNWQKTPQPGVFAIAFTCNPAKERIRLNMEINNQLNVSHQSSDGKKHYFIYKADTLIEVNEPEGIDIMNVSFEDIYIDKDQPIVLSKSGEPKKKVKDIYIKGYIVIKTQVGASSSDYAGNLMLKVTSTYLNNQWKYLGQNLVNPAQVKVTLNKITVIRSADDNSTFSNENKEDLYGYIAAAAFDPTYRLPQAVIKPVESVRPELNKNNILWSSLDDHSETQLHLGTGESKIFNESRIFVVSKNGYIRLVSDLDEDDQSYEENSTTSDGDVSLWTDPVDSLQDTFGTGSDDDRLEEDGEGNKKSLWDVPIQVRQLSVNTPVSKIFTFASGGSKIQVHLKVERIK